jgi:serpin B
MTIRAIFDMKLALSLLSASFVGLMAARAADSKIAAAAVNALGVDLYRASVHGESNLLLSPYSIQNALAMTYAGADDETRTEMQRVLHFPADDDAVHGGFSSLAWELTDAAAKSVEEVKQSKKYGGPSTPLEFHLANRLFAQRGYDFRAPFLSLLKDRYGAPLEEMDYKKNPEKARAQINHWVADQTKDRIRDLIPAGAITPITRLTLVNALYLRAPWSKEFDPKLTKPERFLAHGKDGVNVPTMLSQTDCGYARHDGFQVVTLSYYGDALQFVIVLPDKPEGLASLEKQLTPVMIDEWSHLPAREVILHLPKLHQEPPTLWLGETLKALGMKTAFDDPPHSANFDRMAPRKPEDYLYISAVLHKTFLSLDEKGTEAAAATAVTMMAGAKMVAKPKPVEVRVDHPFLFAIQHVPSGACLFLGRVTDPR